MYLDVSWCIMMYGSIQVPHLVGAFNPRKIWVNIPLYPTAHPSEHPKKKTVNPEFSWVKSVKYFTIPGAREPAVSHPVPGYPKGSSPCYSHQWSCHAVETCWIHPRKIRTCSKKMNRSNTGGGAPVSCENASRWCVKKNSNFTNLGLW